MTFESCDNCKSDKHDYCLFDPYCSGVHCSCKICDDPSGHYKFTEIDEIALINGISPEQVRDQL